MSNTDDNLNKARTNSDPLKYRKDIAADLTSGQYDKAKDTTERQENKK